MSEQYRKVKGLNRCPECDGKVCVVDSRVQERYLRRRRKCLACGYKWTTRETAIDGPEVRVPFDELQKLKDAYKDMMAIMKILAPGGASSREE